MGTGNDQLLIELRKDLKITGGAGRDVIGLNGINVGGKLTIDTVQIDIGGRQVRKIIPAGAAFTTFSIPVTSLTGTNVDLKHLQNMFSIGVTHSQVPNGTRILLDDIHYVGVPNVQKHELGFPVSFVVGASVPERLETTDTQHPTSPINQVVRNLSTIYDVSIGFGTLTLSSIETANLAGGRFGQSDPRECLHARFGHSLRRQWRRRVDWRRKE